MPSILEAIDSALRQREDVRPMIGAFYQLAAQADSATKGRMLASLEGLLRPHHADRTGDLAVLAGAFVELGADATEFPVVVFERLAEELERDPGERGERPEWFYLYERAAMACLASSARLRASFPHRDAIRGRLQRYGDRYGFLGKMALVLDDEPLLVLHPSTQRGFRFRMHGIADNFQLHALLLGALAGPTPERLGGVRPSEEALSASGDGVHMSRETIQSRWQLANGFALRPDGTLDDADPERNWIWNEGVPADIAGFEGTRVVLIGESTIQRGWSAQRVFPSMAGRLDGPEPMPVDEARALLDRIVRSRPDSAN